MKLLILGGTGFLSGTLARRAKEQGHEVWVTTRGQRPVPDGYHTLTVDRTDRAAFAQVIQSAGISWDGVFDCIGMTAADARQDLEVFSSLAGHLVFVSSDFVYDPAYRRFPQSEESDHYLTSGYGGDKRATEVEFLKAPPGVLAWTVLRPGHIYGPGSRLGCLPLHARDPELISHLKQGHPLALVGGGHFLQQPIFAPDLVDLMFACLDNPRAHKQIFCAAGPEAVESRRYYQILADELAVPLKVTEVAVEPYLLEHPEHLSFCCHRIYDLTKLKKAGLPVPSTTLESGLAVHLKSLFPIL